MVVNQSFLDSLKELNNLSRVDVKDPENEEFESARVSAFDEALEDTGEVKVFGNLRKSVNNGINLERKYAGEKASRKSLDWIDNDDNVDEDDDEDDDSVEDDDDDDDDDDDVMDENLDEDIDEVDGVIDADDMKKIRQSSTKNPGIDGDDDNADDMDGDNDVDDDMDGENDVDDDIDGDDVDDEDVDEEDEEDDDEDVDDDDDGDILDNTMHIDLNMIPDDLKNGPTQKLSPEINGDDVDNFSASVNDDNVMKGQATKSQLNLLDKLLESRIRLQKSLLLCNQLPQHDIMSRFTEHAGPQVKESYESAQTLVKELLSKLLKLQEVLCETNTETSSVLTTGTVCNTDPGDEEIPSDTEDEDDEDDEDDTSNTIKKEMDFPFKRKQPSTVTGYGEEIVKRHKAMQPFQDSTIKKWHEKTRLASNVTKSKNFASFDKSVQHQIKQVLLDKDKLIKRTQLMRVPLRILGRRSNIEEETNKEDTVDLHLKDYNENIFDDGDFYHEMLKELIERKSDINADDPIAAGRRWLELQKLRSKIKRKVDTRASKGRKVRYDVHAKLVNFMAPQNVGSMSNQGRNNLFASLFGKKPKVSSY